MLCFHGLPGSRLDLSHQAPLFSDHGIEVIAVDRPGFGRSTRVPGRTLLGWTDDIRVLADRWELDLFSVIGYSSGGKYALACAATLPGRLAMAAVVAAPGPPEMPGFRANMTRLDRVSMTLALRAPALGAALWRPIRWAVLRYPERFLEALEKDISPVDRGYLADAAARRSFLASTQEGLRPGARGVMDEYAIEARPWGFDPARIERQVRIWHGDQDEIVPLAHSTYLAETIPGASLEVLPGVGHFPGREVARIAAALAAAV